jgi:TRAP-type mannitol/chloroaromatic compound transport system permease small subunit
MARRDDSYWLRILRLARWADAPALWVGQATCWLQIPLVALIVFDAVSRRYLRSLSVVVENDLHFLFNSPAIQDAEWHLHTIIFFGALGFGYARNAHVRLDIFRPRFSPAGRLWVEFLGGLFLLVPFVAIVAYEAWIFFHIAWVHDEAAGEANGIGNRWFIKFFIFAGPALLFLSGAAMLARLYVRLFGPRHLAPQTGTAHIANESFSAFD